MRLRGLFRKKKEAGGGLEALPRPLPVNKIRSLTARGFSDTEIANQLRQEGFSQREVDSAMRETLRTVAGAPRPSPPGLETLRPEPAWSDEERVEAPPRPSPKPARPTGPPEPWTATLPEEELEEEGMEPEDMGELPSLPELPGTRRAKPPPRRVMPEMEEEELGEGFEERPLAPVRKPAPVMEHERKGEMEEIAEAVIDEKWMVFQQDVERLRSRIEQLTSRVKELEKTVSDVRGVKQSEVESLKAAVDAYRETIEEVSERTQALESAVKDSLTPMMQSLRSLSETIREMKGGKIKGRKAADEEEEEE